MADSLLAGGPPEKPDKASLPRAQGDLDRGSKTLTPETDQVNQAQLKAHQDWLRPENPLLECWNVATCFKYAPEGSRRKPQHCRFNFTHFVSLPFMDEETGQTRLRVVARTGKEPKLPMWPGASPQELAGRIEVSASYFSDRIGLGSRVETSRKSANRGRVVTVQFGGATYGTCPSNAAWTAGRLSLP